MSINILRLHFVSDNGFIGEGTPSVILYYPAVYLVQLEKSEALSDRWCSSG